MSWRRGDRKSCEKADGGWSRGGDKEQSNGIEGDG